MKGPRVRHGASVSVTLFLVGVTTTFEAGALETLGRYSLIKAAPVSPLLPDSVRTMGQAVEAALLPTGYRLASALSTDPERAQLLALPLPMAHRQLDNMPVRRALETLVGSAFRVIEDPVHRLVLFERCRNARTDSTPDANPSW